jgi:hypothetical protein
MAQSLVECAQPHAERTNLDLADRTLDRAGRLHERAPPTVDHRTAALQGTAGTSAG